MKHRSMTYMWNFKPNERNSIPMDCIRKNKMFLPEYSIVTPHDITPILSSFDGLAELGDYCISIKTAGFILTWIVLSK